MARVKKGVTARRRHKKIISKAKGYYNARRKVFRVAARDGDRSAELAERARHRQSYARAATSDDGGLSCEHRRRKHDRQVYCRGTGLFFTGPIGALWKTGPSLYSKSRIGLTSIDPSRAGGIFAAI